MFPRQFDPAVPELMDLPQPVSCELEVDLENLARINRNFGAYRLVRHFLERWLEHGKSYRLLDLCSGAGDIPRMMVDWARARDVTLQIEAIDFQSATVEIASRRGADYPEITFRQGNVLDLRADSQPSYDFVFCSLALHHFGEDDAVRILASCKALAARATLVADLERSRLAAAAVWLITAVLYREPMTKFDARLSVRRAFSFGEFGGLATRAGWAGFRQARFAIARQAIWLQTGGLPPG
jgi:2-polyprenyl-3-methyl-5-hydroxy-6-metoxy-1,4-benzoquinol methylase